MSNEPLLSFLQASGQINRSSAVEIAECFQYTTLEKGAFLLREGTVCHRYLFVQQGLLRGFAHDTEGRDITTAFYGAGWVALDLASFFQQQPSRENIQALTDCEGWSLTFPELNALFHQRPEFREFGRLLLVRMATALKARTLSLITETAEERYRHLLQTTPAILQHAPLRQVATYLGITDTSLSRIRREVAGKERP
jgi:CRP-like cAMP-binding protein